VADVPYKRVQLFTKVVGQGFGPFLLEERDEGLGMCPERDAFSAVLLHLRGNVEKESDDARERSNGAERVHCIYRDERLPIQRSRVSYRDKAELGDRQYQIDDALVLVPFRQGEAVTPLRSPF
jgi:hypothetical protein